MIEIAIVEDSVPYLEILKSIILSDEKNNCKYSYIDAESFLADLPELNMDIVFVDIQLPNISGIELTYLIKKNRPEIKIIICSSYDDDDKLFSCLKNGANGYILKSSSPEQILQAINDVNTGGAPMSPSIAKRVVSHFYVQEDRKESLAQLTDKEKEILTLLSQGLLYKEIADRQSVTIDTIKKHCGNMYRKLQVSNRTEAINIFFNH